LYPVLFEIGNITVHSYGLMIALGVIVCTIALYLEAPREYINQDHLVEAVIVSVLAGLVGARLMYVALNWSYFAANPAEILFARFEGLSFFGGLFLGAAVLYLWSSRRKISFLKVTDMLAPYLALGYAFGRVGCFLNGCCYGLESDLPWALPVSMHDDILRHPVQLYAALGAILLFIILKLLRSRKPFVGFMLPALFALYGVLRFTTEFFRFEPEFWIGLTPAQVLSLAVTFLSVLVIIFFSGTKRRKTSSTVSGENSSRASRRREKKKRVSVDE